MVLRSVRGEGVDGIIYVHRTTFMRHVLTRFRTRGSKGLRNSAGSYRKRCMLYSQTAHRSSYARTKSLSSSIVCCMVECVRLVMTQTVAGPESLVEVVAASSRPLMNMGNGPHLGYQRPGLHLGPTKVQHPLVRRVDRKLVGADDERLFRPPYGRGGLGITDLHLWFLYARPRVASRLSASPKR